jgi:hypothetical protein
MQELQRRSDPGEFFVHYRPVRLNIEAAAFTATWKQPLIDVEFR